MNPYIISHIKYGKKWLKTIIWSSFSGLVIALLWVRKVKVPYNLWAKFRNFGHIVVACLVAWMISSKGKCRGYPNCTSLMLCTTPWNYVWWLQRQSWLSCGVFLKKISFILWWGFFDRKIRSRLSLNICPIASKNNFQFIKTCCYIFFSCCPQVRQV